MLEVVCVCVCMHTCIHGGEECLYTAMWCVCVCVEGSAR